jgi:opacity protein-like surface antigen
MIRLAALAVLLALAAAPASAQRVEAFGLKLGPTVSTIETDLPSEDPISRRGVNAVLFAQVGLPGPVSLVTEAGYLERGYARNTGSIPDDGSMEPYTYRLDRRMQYVTVAALARLDVARVGPVSAYAVAGPRMNALVGRRGEDTDGGMPGYEYRSVAWDVTAGAGVELVRGLPVLVEARYNAGLNDALDGEGWRGSAYHRATEVLVGFRF